MIEVFSNGLKFAYWTGVSVTRSLGNIAGAFNLQLISQNGQGQRVRLFSGDLVEIDLDGVRVLKGFVGPLSVSFDESSEALSVSGHEMTCDLVDCCSTKQMEWRDKMVDRIIGDICSDFGISFYNPFGVDFGAPVETFSVEPGAKAADAISKLCKIRGLLPCSDGMGKVFVIKPSDCPRGPKLAQGENIVSAAATYNSEALYSDYYVYGTGKAQKRIQAHRHDPSVRTRPLVIVDTNSIDKKSVEARAEWEMSIRRAKGISFNIGVSDWMRDDGRRIWEPGIICAIDAPALLLDEPVDMIVSQVTYSFDVSSGKTAMLTLVPIDSFEPEPETKKPQANKSPKRKAVNIWTQVEKAVKR
jgi:prophage tail gpP-like protein